MLLFLMRAYFTFCRCLKALSGATFIDNTGKILISSLQFAVTETDVSECETNLWKSHTNCAHKEMRYFKGRVSAVIALSDLNLINVW